MRFGAEIPHRRDEAAAGLGQALAEFDAREFRNALGRFATGVTIITARDADGMFFGVTANSYNSVSLDPPLVLWSLARSSGSFEKFMACEAFAVHVLTADQEELAMRFATRRREDRFADLQPGEGYGGIPLLDGCAARFECSMQQRVDGGDHVIFLGRVVGFDHRDAAPLLFHAGRFARVASVTEAGSLA